MARKSVTNKGPLLLPWRVVIDTAEQHPYTFQGLRADADYNYRPLQVETVLRSMGRFPNSWGDYSLERVDPDIDDADWSGIYHCQIERKSIEDCYSTLLGFTDGHRERFEKELENLTTCEAAMVVVECNFPELLNSAPAWGTRTRQQNAKTLMRTVLSYQRKYRVPWLFAGSRRLAEIATLRFLEGFWRDHIDHIAASRKSAI